MNGRAQDFQLADETFSLKRPAFTEMIPVVDRIDAGEVENVLLEAAGEAKESFKKAIDEADHEQVVTLWDEWLEFAGVATFRKNFLEPREQKALEAQARMFKTMKSQGLITETFLEDLLNNQMTL